VITKSKILFIIPYPLDSAPSQRFRFEQYFNTLEHFEYETSSFIDKKSWEILYKKGNNFRKVTTVINGLFKRFKTLIKASHFDFIFIHRESIPFGPPIFEFILAKALRKKIIFDFDDAIWLNNYSQNNEILKFFKCARLRTNKSIKWSYKVSCGNKYLQNYALKLNSKSTHLPTTIDTSYHSKSRDFDSEKTIIGWTGSHSTIMYLDAIIPVLKQLEERFQFEFHVISDFNPKFDLKSYRFIPWNIETEIEDLSKFKIGIMPLPDTEWAKGKCSFKALQYMALGIPPIASPVGTNLDVIKHGVNGFLCTSDEEWKIALEKLLLASKKELDPIMANAIETIESHYSYNANKTRFLSLFE
jgi:glycosyltransferase involved in cell wall biosynthesis